MEQRSRNRLIVPLVLGIVLAPVYAIAQGGPDGTPGGLMSQIPPGMYGRGRLDMQGLPFDIGKRLAQVGALRSIVPLRLTVQNIKAAVPILKKIETAENALAVGANKAVDDEFHALLSAKPESMPASRTPQLRTLLQQYNNQRQSAWAELTKAIGAAKAVGLRRLVEPGMMMGIEPGMGGGPQPGVPEEPDRAGGPSGQPSKDGEAQPPDDPQGDQPEPGMQPNGARARQHGQPNDSRSRFGGQRPFMMGFGGFQPRISITDLIDLLEKRAAAMKP